MINHSTSGWTLTTDARSLKAYPALQETIWQKNAAMPPNGQYDKIGLHRLVKPGATSKGVVFFLPGTYGNGEGFVSNPPQNNWTWTENASQPIYWANRGFDVYAIDYRTHFVPMTLNASQLSFMANWGWTQWISDIKEAVDKAKVESSTAKVFLAGHSFGGIASMNYATKYWQEDLRGIILLDGGNATKCPTTNKFNLTAAINSINNAGAWAYDFPTLSAAAPSSPGLIFQFRYAFENPGAPAEYPLGKPLTPTINPVTNKTWTNITEYQAVTTNLQMSNVKGGYADINTVMQNLYVQDRYWPARLTLEMTADRDWDNCPYASFDFDDHYSEINVPLIGFVSELRNLALGGPVAKGIANSDVTSIVLLKYAHNDVIRGTYSARDVSQPVFDWMLSHYQAPGASAFGSVTVMAGQTWYFFAHSSSNIGTCTYQWYEGTTLLTGQTSMVLPVAKTAAGTYTYTCKIKDTEGTAANSNTVTLTVINK
jgi:pimeloyl-ACP methyl ester carboxylesterase